jgi:2-phospho-L-lactate transferase/gluconeogenesis factor (CofD/UPF0052 family)
VASARDDGLRVVLFSGGRGSDALTRQLVSHPRISLTVAVNGYDDGASTGEVRRLLGDSLGPSDFRKNASRLASELGTCAPELLRALDARLPAGIAPSDAVAALRRMAASGDLEEAAGARLDVFLESCTAGGSFDFGDCSVGNLVFAGAYLRAGREFNRAIDDYCALVGLPAGMIENVTEGTNAYLVALDASGELLRSEASIVDVAAAHTIRDLFLIDRPLCEEEARAIASGGPEFAAIALEARRPPLALNPRLGLTLAAADLIIYAPGTQHSSLFPSYLTPGLSAAIASNLRAFKLLITNIQSDAEIAGSCAVDLVDRALFYLTGKGRQALPAPCLITHYLLNEPGRHGAEPYVPLGALDILEDPRLIRIANYEDGITGRHDARRVLGPFLDKLLSPSRRPAVAVLLYDGRSMNKVTQTLLEMIRGGLGAVPIVVTAFCIIPGLFDPEFVAKLPFPAHAIPDASAFLDAVRSRDFEYVGLFDSSGMYRGEDLVALLAQLTMGRFDAVWGSRRLSVRDIAESYRFRYAANRLLGALSYVGSHLMSLAYLALYGRYISDTLSAVRTVRASEVIAAGVDPTDRDANQFLLARLLRRKADVLELPVQFLPLSPEKVKRTTVLDGLRALFQIVRLRFS